jgi:hypothetical protein
LDPPQLRPASPETRPLIRPVLAPDLLSIDRQPMPLVAIRCYFTQIALVA